MSRIIESLRVDLATFAAADAISKLTLREFDSVCLPPVRKLGAGEIRTLRGSPRFGQSVFAHHWHTSVSAVRKWEQGQPRPAGPALKLLYLIADKGVRGIP